MQRHVPVRLFALLIFVGMTLPQPSRAACVSALDVAALDSALRGELRCARLRLDLGGGAPCTVSPPPPCAGSGVDAVLDLVTGDGLPPSPVAVEAYPQLRCQRAVLGAAKRYVSKRVRELSRGRRQARLAAVFAPVERACDRLSAAQLQTTALPTLGAPCAGAVAADGPIDGARLARCARAALEHLAAELTGGILRPNVVVVLTDDQNVASMPWMARVERLRARSVDFANAFVTTPICAPSRASLLSARYAHHHGVLGNYLAAPTFDASSTIATWLSDAGYETALVGKYMNFAANLEAIPPGWDEWQVLLGEEFAGNGYTDYYLDENGVRVRRGGSPGEYSTDLLLRRSLGFLRDKARVPFFLVFAPFAPHPSSIPAPRHAGSLSRIEQWRPANWHESDVTLKPNWVKFMKAHTTTAKTAAADDERSRQLETLLAVDEAVGRIEDSLEVLGLTDNTLLVFTSDHGNHWGEHWWSSKFTAYEESLRVPLVVSYPVLAPMPARRDELVANIDLAPTIAELAGVTIPEGLDGRSAAALLAAPGEAREDFFIRSWGAIIVPPWEGVRGERFKYVKTLTSGGVTEELYDVVADPYEITNLAFDPAHAATVEALRQRLVELRDG